MSTEITAAVSVPCAEVDNQKLEKEVKLETHPIEQGDVSPSKEACEAEKSNVSETCVTKAEETPVVDKAPASVVVEVEKADHVPVPNVKADHECGPIAPAEDVPEKTKPLEAEKAQTIETVVDNDPVKEVENKPVEEIAIEAVIYEPETQASEACETKKVETIATEAVKEEPEKAIETYESKPVEKIAIEAVEQEPEKAIETYESKPVEKIATEAVEKEPETRATEPCEDKAVENVAIEAVEKESEKKEATEADETKIQDTPASEEKIDEKPKTEAYESTPLSETVKPEEDVEVEKETIADDQGKTICESSTNEESQTLQSIIAAEKEEATEKIYDKTEEAGTNAADEVAEKTVEGEQKSDRELVVAKEVVVVKEEECKDIKENEEEAPALESCKDDGEASKDQVQDVSAKPAQKQSGNNIMSKVKQSLVKVKKAIIGKSPSSKVLAPEIKGDRVNVK